MTTLIPLFLSLACGDKDPTTPTDREPGDSSTNTDSGDPTGDSDEPTDSGDPVVRVRKAGTIFLDTGTQVFPVAGASVWAGEESTAVETDIWGAYVLDVPEGDEVCVRIPGTSAPTCGVDPDITLEPFEDLVWGRLVDSDGNVPVSRGIPTSDVIVTLGEHTTRVGADGFWAGGGGIGSTALFGVVIGLNTTKEKPAEPIEALLESTETNTVQDNSAPVLSATPEITDGATWYTGSPGGTIDYSLGCTDPDGDTCTVTVDWGDGVVSEGSEGTVTLGSNPGNPVAYLSDGNGGTSAVSMPLRRTSDLVVNDVINAEGDVGYDYSISLIQGGNLQVMDDASFLLVDSDGSVPLVVTTTGPDITPHTQLVYAHGDVVNVDADLQGVTTTTIFGDRDSFVSTADKSFQLEVPVGGVRDSSGNVIKDEVEVAYRVWTDENDLYGVTRHAVSGDEQGAIIPSSGVYLSVRSLKDPTETYTLEGATMWLADSAELKSPALYVYDRETARFEWTRSVRSSSGYSTVDLTDFDGTMTATIAELETDIGCIRVYVPPGRIHGQASLQVDDGSVAYVQLLSGPLTILGGLPLNANYSLTVLDGVFNPKDTVTVNTSTALLTSIDEVVPYDKCVDVTLPSAPPVGTFLTKKFMDTAQLSANLGATFDADDVGFAYLKAVDPNADKRTFEDWLVSLDWSKGTGGSFDPRQTTGDDTMAIYGNDGDLGFGREMHLKTWDDWDPAQTGEDPIIAMYTTNYASVHNAAQGTSVIATVAMEYSPAPSGGAYYTKFFVWDVNGDPLYNVPLDDFGAKALPDLCTNCHGGEPAAEYEFSVDGSGDLVYPNDGRMEAFGRFPTWIPYAVESFGYSPFYTLPNQQDEFLELNQAVLKTNAPADTREMIHGWYGSTNVAANDLSGATLTDQDTTWMPTLWDTTDWNSTGADSARIYEDVYQPYCRSCHLSFPTNFADPVEFFTYYGFNIQTQVCSTPTTMPQAQVTQANLHSDIDARLALIDEMTLAAGWTHTACPD